jgi:endonuclease/exonuclease/phosphatase family metal-dependent hydrolase
MRDRLALQAKGLAQERADVLVLQEVSGTTPARYCSMLDALIERLRLEDSEAAYNVAFAVGDRDLLTNRWYSGVAILSRFELRAARIYRFPTQGTLGLENRVALKVSIRGAHGDVDVITTHLQYGGGDVAAMQVQELLDWIPRVADSRTTTVLAGDLNLTPESRPIRRIIEQGFVDAWSEVNPDDPGHTFRHEGLYDATGRARERLDYVFLSEQTGIRAARLVLNRPIDLGPGRPKRWLWPSDHNGVRVDLIPVAY